VTGRRSYGWYRPSHNGAAVLVLHGGGSDRRGALRHARMLAPHGYGVLLYDARGRGESEGAPNDYGWGWPKDVAGALAFLKGRPDVDPHRIGALGLSTGADVLIEAAATRRDIAALVIDGAAAGSFEDWRRLRGNEIGAGPGWFLFTTLRAVSADGPARRSRISCAACGPRRSSSPPGAATSGTSTSSTRAARGRAEHWNVPDADHTRAIRQVPASYERRVVRFLDAKLR
jgi:hypothetical protein